MHSISKVLGVFPGANGKKVCLKFLDYRSHVRCRWHGLVLADAPWLINKTEDCSRLYSKTCTLLKQRPPGGARILDDLKRVYDYNNWDNVVWDEEQEEEAQRTVQEQSKTLVSADQQEIYEKEADQFWDKFYSQHQNKFFKDRHWLFTEFPELAPQGVSESIPKKAEVAGVDSECGKDNLGTVTEEAKELPHDTVRSTVTMGESTASEKSTESGEPTESCGTFPGAGASYRMFEVGCGVGNTVFPVLQTNNDPAAFMYCCDLSSNAIQIVKEHQEYEGGRCYAFVCDVADDNPQMPFPEDSIDIIILIFFLSAIHPDKMQGTISCLARYLKPGGLMVFRDYGRYDLAQLRFKKGRCLTDNFYARGDGTRVYFFTQEELDKLFSNAGLEKQQNIIDRRLQVNRSRQLKMYRVWIQCKYRKPIKR